MTTCTCGHPENVHGGFARLGTECAYRGCDCVRFTSDGDCRHGCNGDCTRSGSDRCDFTCHPK